MITIDEKITNWEVVPAASPQILKVESKTPEVKIVQMPIQPEAIKRPDGELEGSTYKLRSPDLDEAIYVTINNVLMAEENRLRPIEIFINSKNMEAVQWITALTRVISVKFREGYGLKVMLDELKGVYNPNGGYRVKGFGKVHSVVAHIAKIIEAHCKKIGFSLEPPLTEEVTKVIEDKKQKAEKLGLRAKVCHKCFEESLVVMDGCEQCLTCGWSKCN